jgi:peptidoglycan-associated lipoprotein
MKRYTLGTFIVLSAAFVVMAGCAQKKVRHDILGASRTPAEGVTASEGKAAPADLTEEVISKEADLKATPAEKQAVAKAEPSAAREDAGRLHIIYFDYNKHSIREGEVDSLAKNARWLKVNSGVKILIEGHADERGETEYNLALGDKRAVSVKRYLEDMGIGADRVATVSYGEEKPADQGHDEGAWGRNRRAEFKVRN